MVVEKLVMSEGSSTAPEIKSIAAPIKETVSINVKKATSAASEIAAKQMGVDVPKPIEVSESLDKVVSKDEVIKEVIKADKVEDKKNEEGEKPEEINSETERIAYIVKQEKRLQVEKAQAKEEIAKEKEKFETDKKVHLEDVKRAADIQKEVGQLKNNPGAVLEFMEKHLGMSITDLSDFYIKGTSTEYQLNKFKADLERENEEKKIKEENDNKEKLTNQQAENVKVFKSQIQDHINTNNTTYKLIHKLNAQDLVYQVIEENFNNTKKIMDIKEAAEKVEQYYKDLIFEEQKVSELKVDDKSTKVTNPEIKAISDLKQPLFKSKIKKTITNNPSSQSSKSPIKETIRLTDKERHARAVAALK